MQNRVLSPVEVVVARNPWRQMQQDRSGFCLPEDCKTISRFNDCCSHEYFVHLEIVPEPYIGSPDAPIWLLNLNPGFHSDDLRHPESVKEAQLRNLELRSGYFWFLDESFPETPGTNWWKKRLRALCEDCGTDAVSKNIFCVEYFPYHSKKFKRIPKRISKGPLQSQEYTADLVRAGIQEKKYFIRLRGKTLWSELVPTLACEATKNPRCAYISPGNFENYADLCERIMDR